MNHEQKIQPLSLWELWEERWAESLKAPSSKKQRGKMVVWEDGQRSGRMGIKFSVEDSDLELASWRITPHGYTRHQILGKGLSGHRIVLSRKLGRPLSTSELADHINGDRLDNRRDNLRVVDHFGNARNVHAARGKTGVIGVHMKYGKYCAYLKVTINGKRKHILGRTYDTPLEAAKAYNAAAAAYGFLTQNDLSQFSEDGQKLATV